MSRPKMLFRNTCATADVATAPSAGYRVYATYRRTPSGEYEGDLKVVRIADARLIFPFDGAPSIGPMPTAQAARDAAQALGDRLVAADILNPE